ncbi:hypothetical protein PR202_ga16517 [Eleusine coracana subsp. coracana]|uniref:Gamma-glutamylcyclotransferase family protein n=1 Tax=Eleusine coracana subsp. coracana TaxID=191504 RepID=A0AAV5CN21_ELECO|nr:hypothetical protein PR202_ga16517 [Eleusine coracana subsp. coracana]
MVFVYGTLKRGFPNHPLLAASASPLSVQLLPRPRPRLSSAHTRSPSSSLPLLPPLADSSPESYTPHPLPHLLNSMLWREPTSASTSAAGSLSWLMDRTRWWRRRVTLRTRATRRLFGGAAVVRPLRSGSTPWTMPPGTSRPVGALPVPLRSSTPSMASSTPPRTTRKTLLPLVVHRQHSAHR